MQQEDVLELVGVIGKLNRTIDSQQNTIDVQQHIIKQYVDKYGPLESMTMVGEAPKNDSVLPPAKETEEKKEVAPKPPTP